MAQLQTFKCPNCAGAISFDSTLQKMKCPYCDTELDVEAFRAYENDSAREAKDEIHWETSPGAQWQEHEEDGLCRYLCSSCGGEVIGDENTAATACPFCDNPIVVTEKLSGFLKPEIVIPFQKSKKDAIEALKRHYLKKKLLPKVFRDENRIREVKGIYVPFWLFDADVDASLRYKASRVRTWSDARYHYTETSFFAISRGGSLSFSGIPVDGSRKIDDVLMESLEPFSMEGAVNFETAYLAGYLADKYDVEAEESKIRASERIKQSTEDAFRQTVSGYNSVVTEFSSIQTKNGKARYALYPVWLLNTRWKDKTYTFAMNGQTGKIVGDLPLDWGAFFRWLVGLGLAIGATILLILYLFWLF